MGRGGGHGGGGGGSHRSHSSSRSSFGGSHSSHHSSSHSSWSSSSHSSWSSSNHSSWSSYSRPSYHSYSSYNTYRTPYRRSYPGNYSPSTNYNTRGNGCLGSTIAIIIMIMIATTLISYFADNNGEVSSWNIDEDIVAKSCQQYYMEEVGGKDNAMVLYTTYSEEFDEEYYYVWYGDDASRFVASTLGEFIDIYDSNYDDDLGFQLGRTLSTYADVLKSMGYDPIEVGKFESDTSKIINDNLDWCDTDSNVIDSARKLYDASGVQFYVATVNYDTLPIIKQAKQEKRATLGKVLVTILVVGGVTVASTVFVKANKKKKAEKQKKLEEEIRILNTPLDEMAGQAGGNTVDDLMKKYEKASRDSVYKDYKEVDTDSDNMMQSH